MNILYIGELAYGGTCLMRMNALKSLGYEVTGINILPENFTVKYLLDRINFRLSYKFDFERLNKKIINVFTDNNFDIVWIDKGKRVFPEILKYLKKNKSDLKLVHINPDDPFGNFRIGWGNFIKSIPYYDYHFVAREANVNEYKSLGAAKVFVYDRSFDPELHKPIMLTEDEKKKYFCKVGFIGSWAKDREKSIVYLINNGIEVAVWGNAWQKGQYWDTIKNFYRGPGLKGLEYSKAINGMEIALHFLRKENRDEQDSRTFEIPACGTFMLAERTKKHEEFFKENEEAVFFDNDKELLDKLNFYLLNPYERKRIAEKGHQRSVRSGYSHPERIKKMINILNQA